MLVDETPDVTLLAGDAFEVTDTAEEELVETCDVELLEVVVDVLINVVSVVGHVVCVFQYATRAFSTSST